MYDAIVKELELRKSYVDGQKIQTIYFGGGTPSVFTNAQISGIINCISSTFEVEDTPEITLEANPDDLSESYLEALKATAVNRLSIGIQTFDETRLAFLNRKHSAREASKALENAAEFGYHNITADLIMGIPPENDDYWKADLDKILQYKLPHLSVYSLTVEDQTTFGNWKRKGRLHEVSEELMARQFEFTMERLETAGYLHYEVSNYALPGFESRHNSAYWAGDHYLGVGPGAHSFDGSTRSANIEHNQKYISSIREGQLPMTIEILTPIQRMNEFLLTGLRTKKGVNIGLFDRLFHCNLLTDRERDLDPFLNEKWLELDGSYLRPTKKGFLMADEISLRLFYDSE